MCPKDDDVELKEDECDERSFKIKLAMMLLGGIATTCGAKKFGNLMSRPTGRAWGRAIKSDIYGFDPI